MANSELGKLKAVLQEHQKKVQATSNEINKELEEIKKLQKEVDSLLAGSNVGVDKQANIAILEAIASAKKAIEASQQALKFAKAFESKL